MKATLLYMELAEMGLSTAMLNAGLLLEKYNVFDSTKSFFAANVKHPSSPKQFNINKYLAFNYFKMAINHHDTKEEALIKLGDFYYYGLHPNHQGEEESSSVKAAHIYKYVESNAKDPELKG